jgi:hypothetical protein
LLGIIPFPTETNALHGVLDDVPCLNGARWVPDPPNADVADSAVLAVAAGSVDEADGRVAAGRVEFLADEN